MTQNEVNILKKAVLDATEVYVDARLGTADFVKTQIGVVESVEENMETRKFYHSVKCNATSGTEGVVYHNVLSVGNVEFPVGSVVFIVAPNAQFTNQFILGKLDDTPCNISGGSINIGNGNFMVDVEGNVTANSISANGGTIGSFFIEDNSLKNGDAAIISENVIGCGFSDAGIAMLVGSESTNLGMLQLSASGNENTCLNGIRLYGNGFVYRYDASGTLLWSRNLANIPTG